MITIGALPLLYSRRKTVGTDFGSVLAFHRLLIGIPLSLSGGGSFGVAPKHSIELPHVHNANHALSLRSPRHDFIFDVIRHSHFGIQSIVAFLDLHFERGD